MKDQVVLVTHTDMKHLKSCDSHSCHKNCSLVQSVSAGGALKKEDFVSIRDELFAVTPLESLEAMDSMIALDDPLDESVY